MLNLQVSFRITSHLNCSKYLILARQRTTQEKLLFKSHDFATNESQHGMKCVWHCRIVMESGDNILTYKCYVNFKIITCTFAKIHTLTGIASTFAKIRYFEQFMTLIILKHTVRFNIHTLYGWIRLMCINLVTFLQYHLIQKILMLKIVYR